ncbi:UNVERIFIED_CONTAM: hypothetical protein RMT77_003007 [Armadillidium vulgare]
MTMFNFGIDHVKILPTLTFPKVVMQQPTLHTVEIERGKNNISSGDFSSVIDLFAFHNVTIIPEYNCSEPFVTIFDGGRLGNNICQFMSLLLFRIEMGMRIAISKLMKSYLLKIFANFSVPILPHHCFPVKSKSTFKNDFNHVYEYFTKHFSKKMKKSKLSTLPKIKYYNYVKQYPCPLLLLDKYREKLKKKLRIRSDLLQKARNILQATLKSSNRKNVGNVTLISAHVRRTDYLEYSKKRKLIFPTVKYYKMAFEFYRKR